MSIDIGELVSEGFERTIARNGLLLVALIYVVSVPSAVFSADMNRQAGSTGPMMGGAPVLGLSPVVAGVLSLVFTVVSLVVTVGAVRTFVGEDTEELHQEDFTRNLGWVLVNLLVGWIVFFVLLFLGFLLLIIPGLFLLTALFFWYFYVIVEGENFVDAFASSWEATSGERLTLFALGVVAVIISAVVNLVFGIPAFVASNVVTFLISQAGSAFASVFVTATAARAFVRLADRERGGVEEAAPREHAVE